MRRILADAAVIVVLGLAAVAVLNRGQAQGPNNVGSTQAQATVSDALQTLKFKYVQPKGNQTGGPMEFEVTRDTRQHLRGLTTFWVDSDGSIHLKKPIGAAGAAAPDKQ